MPASRDQRRIWSVPDDWSAVLPVLAARYVAKTVVVVPSGFSHVIVGIVSVNAPALVPIKRSTPVCPVGGQLEVAMVTVEPVDVHVWTLPPV